MPARFPEIHAAFCTDHAHRFQTVYGGEQEARLRAMVRMLPQVLTSEAILSARDGEFADIAVLFSTWGMPRLSDEALDNLPSLRAVFYAAGSVKGFAEPYLQRGIAVSSAWQANAIAVADFTVAHILLACKGYFRNVESLRGPNARRWRGIVPDAPGIYGQRIGVIGQGAVGRRIIQLLEPFDLIPVPFDGFPNFDHEELRRIFQTCHVVTNHLPDKENTRRIYNGELFRLLPLHATFINTGRGAQVDEDALVQVLSERRDLTAIIDVTCPEPPAMDSPLRRLPNIHLSSHISGSINEETRRMAVLMIEEFERWLSGQPLQFQVTPEIFATLA